MSKKYSTFAANHSKYALISGNIALLQAEEICNEK